MIPLPLNFKSQQPRCLYFVLYYLKELQLKKIESMKTISLKDMLFEFFASLISHCLENCKKPISTCNSLTVFLRKILALKCMKNDIKFLIYSYPLIKKKAYCEELEKFLKRKGLPLRIYLNPSYPLLY